MTAPDDPDASDPVPDDVSTPTPTPLASPRSDADGSFHQRLAAILERESPVAAFARRIGVSHPALVRLQHGGEPTMKVLVRIAEGAGVSVDWLATGRAPPPAAAPPSLEAPTELETFFALHRAVMAMLESLHSKKGADIVNPYWWGQYVLDLTQDVLNSQQETGCTDVAPLLALLRRSEQRLLDAEARHAAPRQIRFTTVDWTVGKTRAAPAR